ncbi:MAG: 2-oxo acid dehydrogenase subunit E2 [Phycisphaerales bacterium]
MSDTIPIHVPRENVNDETVKLLVWRVPSGGKVEKGQPIAELETSKTNFEIEAPSAGFIAHSAQAGEEIAVGGLLCNLCADAVPPAPASGSRARADSASAAHTPAAAPAASGHANGSHKPLAPADHAALAEIAPQSTRLSAKAQELVKARGLDPARFANKGLLRERDVLEALGEAPAAGTRAPAPTHSTSNRLRSRPTAPPVAPSAVATPSAPAASSGSGPVPAAGVPFATTELARSKRIENRYLASGQQHTVASVITVACPTRGLRAAAAASKTQASTTAIILFEAARLLKKYPQFNAFHADGAANTYQQVNIGFAVDGEHGLKVPVIRDADQLGLAAISEQIMEFMVQYLNNQIPVAALAGGTFTITDLSGEGVFAFHPLINQGQSAILGVGAEFFPPGSREGMFNLILAFDHQLSEGRAAARFLNDLRSRLDGYEQALGGAPASGTAPQVECSECLTPMNEAANLGYHMVQVLAPDGATRVVCSRCVLGRW